MSPPSTSVWLSRRTTDVSASRLMMSGEPLGGRGSPTSLTVCFTSRATTRLSLMRGVTVRMMPASRYSTALGEDVASGPAAAWATWLRCPSGTPTCCVTMGTEFETLMTAFLFSEVRIVGLDSTVSWP